MCVSDQVHTSRIHTRACYAGVLRVGLISALLLYYNTLLRYFTALLYCTSLLHFFTALLLLYCFALLHSFTALRYCTSLLHFFTALLYCSFLLRARCHYEYCVRLRPTIHAYKIRDRCCTAICALHRTVRRSNICGRAAMRLQRITTPHMIVFMRDIPYYAHSLRPPIHPSNEAYDTCMHYV